MATTTPDNEPSISMASEDVASRVRRIAPTVLSKVRHRLIPFLCLLYIVAYLDRINVGFAALQMNQALGFSSSTYGFGAGIFFLSYVLFEVPSNVVLARIGARLWIARIMISWGIVSAAMMLVRGATGFYAMRFLLGAAEAGFFPGIIFYLTRWFPARERARTVAAFMTAVLAAGMKNPRSWLLAIVYFTVPVALYATSFWLPQILKSASGGSDFEVGVLSAIPYLCGAAGMVVTGRHSDRTGERRWHVAAAA